MYKATDKAGEVKYYASKELKDEDLAFYCQGCGGQMILKAGDIKVPHFAHKGADCGYSKYNIMSDWHKAWQSYFPEDRKEVCITDNKTKRRKEADAVNSDGLVIEFQHSKMLRTEKQARDVFYEKMIWVLDGATFNFWETKGQSFEYKDYLERKRSHESEQYKKKHDAYIQSQIIYSQLSEDAQNAKNRIRERNAVIEKINAVIKSIESLKIETIGIINFELPSKDAFQKLRAAYNDSEKHDLGVIEKMRNYDPEKHQIIEFGDFEGEKYTDVLGYNEGIYFWANSTTPVFIDKGDFLWLIKPNDCFQVVSREAFFKKYIH